MSNIFNVFFGIKRVSNIFNVFNGLNVFNEFFCLNSMYPMFEFNVSNENWETGYALMNLRPVTKKTINSATFYSNRKGREEDGRGNTARYRGYFFKSNKKYKSTPRI